MRFSHSIYGHVHPHSLTPILPRSFLPPTASLPFLFNDLSSPVCVAHVLRLWCRPLGLHPYRKSPLCQSVSSSQGSRDVGELVRAGEDEVRDRRHGVGV